MISGVGIGAGFVFNRQIYRGEFGGAGEVGHMVIFPEGKNCYCGRQGCLEAHAGEKYIIEETKRLLSADKDSPLCGTIVVNHRKGIGRGGAGDHHARKALYTAGRNLGIGLVNLINIVNPAAIILSGKI